MSNPYNEDYFLRGQELGISGYTNYHWMPDLTIPMAQAIVDHCGIVKGSRVLDFGCARGYLVKAMLGLGFDAYGVDLSEWALENCDPEVKGRVTKIEGLAHRYMMTPFDWIVAKDVLEHVEYVERMILALMDAATVGVFAVVPLSPLDKNRYVIPSYEEDITHIQRWSLPTWVRMFIHPGWSVQASYRLKGVKDNYYKKGWECGNGFIIARRIEE